MLPITTRFTRGCLPHWEVAMGRYFVTVRCHDSLPRDVTTRLVEIERELARILPRSAQFGLLQRRYFATVEKFADTRCGSGPLTAPAAAQIVADALAGLAHEGVEVPHYSILPNHWHALFVPSAASIDLHRVVMQLKGRTAHAINGVLGSRGPVWQREWFDRWIRNESEWTRCVEYVHDNPVKAGLVQKWQDHRWTR